MKTPSGSWVPVEGFREEGDRVTDAFTRPACRVYADTANYGLPPKTAVAAMERELRSWSDGSASWMADWDPAGDECRKLIAPFFGASEREIALLPAVSVGAGLVKPICTKATRCSCPRTTPLDPFSDARRRHPLRAGRPPSAVCRTRGCRARIQPASWLRATSGRMAGACDLRCSCRSGETSRGAGPGRCDAFGRRSSGGCRRARPRLRSGSCVQAPSLSAWGRVHANGSSHWKELAPVFSGWRSASEPYVGFYGGTLEDLHDDAARFDVSLAWHPWIGAQASLELLASVEPEQIRRHTVDLACQLAEELGLEPTGSSILGIPTNGQLDGSQAGSCGGRCGRLLPGRPDPRIVPSLQRCEHVQTIASVLGPILDLGRRTARSAL